MSLLLDNPHVKAVTFSGDPRPGNPYGQRMTVLTDLNPDTNDPRERQEVVELQELCRYALTLSPTLTGATWKFA